ncbi:protein of unknown function DUF59 [Methylobacterium sp. 4-46]|uniref:metal-sulfur cluster assembly factor n=1 Tax=unclassified Methylobacterium TaxID=2615210 RepID=UPI000152CBA6|nr:MULTISPECIES: metal-sulfur cluster assembly factor [Methylobacterium]ACA20396.1 protein of unknown function DUF59 [Methylobacterium sp. 4-46]WFT79565.1 metal-sulfur cluster assembly factor [Methylobacterium nodulans]
MVSWWRGRAVRRPAEEESGGAATGGRAPLDPELLDCLSGVPDPELGVSIVHLGLVYRAVRGPARIEVDLTLTTRTCPLGALIVDAAREHLRRRFNDCPDLLVRLVWSPVWTPERITEQGLALLERGPPSRHGPGWN